MKLFELRPLSARLITWTLSLNDSLSTWPQPAIGGFAGSGLYEATVESPTTTTRTGADLSLAGAPSAGNRRPHSRIKTCTTTPSFRSDLAFTMNAPMVTHRAPAGT